MGVFADYLALAIGALLPVVNPIGSSLVFLGMVGSAPPRVFRMLAWKVALTTALFLLAMDLGGAAVLKLFGISLPVVQLAGGLVLAAMGWELLNKKDAPGQQDQTGPPADLSDLQGKIFYPFTFPVTAGPGVLVVTLTLSAHASKGTVLTTVLAHLGVLAGVAVMCLAVFVFYAYAPAITARVSAATAHGILRVIAFILFCIGVQIAWNGLSGLVQSAGFVPK
jgi:multiple antibiotic resistance protein